MKIELRRAALTYQAPDGEVCCLLYTSDAADE